MLILETFYLIASSLLFYPIGKLLFRDLDFIFQFFIGLLIAGLLISFTARFLPGYSREILSFLSFSSLILLYGIYRHNFSSSLHELKSNFQNKLKIIFLFFLLFIFFLFLLRDFSPFFLLFESHDVHVFGPTIELFNSNYIGNLKNPIIFPLELSSYHIFPGTFLGVANFLNPSIDLVTLVNAKYILVSFFFAYGFFKVLNYHNFSFSSFLIGITLLLFFKETVGYNLSISSYLYQLILIFISIIFFEFESKPNTSMPVEAFIGLLMILICVKIPIFYAILPSLLYLFYKNPIIFFRPRLLFVGILSFLSLVAIVAIPQSPQVAEITRYSLMNIFNFDSARSLAGLWFVENRFLDMFNFFNLQIFDSTQEKYFILSVKMLYILIFYFGLAFLALKSFKPSIAKNALKIYIITAILGWLFVRNNGNLDQQNHLFFNISILSLMLFFRAAAFAKHSFRFNENGLIFLLILLFVTSDFKNFTNPKLSGDSISYRKNNSIALSEFLAVTPISDQDRLILDPESPFWRQALISQMSGKRIYYEDLVNSNIEFDSYHLAQYAIK